MSSAGGLFSIINTAGFSEASSLAPQLLSQFCESHSCLLQPEFQGHSWASWRTPSDCLRWVSCGKLPSSFVVRLAGGPTDFPVKRQLKYASSWKILCPPQLRISTLACWLWTSSSPKPCRNILSSSVLQPYLLQWGLNFHSREEPRFHYFEVSFFLGHISLAL